MLLEESKGPRKSIPRLNGLADCYCSHRRLCRLNGRWRSGCVGMGKELRKRQHDRSKHQKLDLATFLKKNAYWKEADEQVAQ